MTDKEKILAEIERLRSDFPKVINQKEKDCQWLYLRGLNKIRDFINSLPEEPVSGDLEEAALLHLSKHYDTSVIWDEDEKCVVRDFKVGAQWKEEQMMKTAVDGKIYETQVRSKLKATTIGEISGLKYRVGDKVKIIIIKDE